MPKGNLKSWQDRNKSLAYWWVVGLGSGLLKPAPGSWGSLAGLFIGWALFSSVGWFGLLTSVVVVFYLSVRAIDTIEAQTGIHDAPEIVIDEFVGQWITMLPLAFFPFGWLELGLSFVFFRMFDILKPWPISILDRQVSGGFGVMIDDVVAGCFAGAALWITVPLLP